MRPWLLLPAVVLGVAADGPPLPCAVPPRPVCLPEAEHTTRTHTAYRCCTRTICLPYCKPACGPQGDCGECGRPRQVRVLIKRFVKEEKWEVKCKPHEPPPVVECVPTCPPAAQSSGAGGS
jgi:hypothetical protein